MQGCGYNLTLSYLPCNLGLPSLKNGQLCCQENLRLLTSCISRHLHTRTLISSLGHPLRSMASKRKAPATKDASPSPPPPPPSLRHLEPLPAGPHSQSAQANQQTEDISRCDAVMRLLLALPEALCRQAFKFLSPDDLRSCCLLNHELFELASNDELWQPQVARRFGTMPSSYWQGGSARQRFVALTGAPCSVCHVVCGASEEGRPPLANNHRTRFRRPGSCESCTQLCCARCSCRCRCLNSRCTEPFGAGYIHCGCCGGWAHRGCVAVAFCFKCNSSFCGDCMTAQCSDFAFCSACRQRKCLDCTQFRVCQQCDKLLCSDCEPSDSCQKCDRSLCSACNDVHFCSVCDKYYCFDCSEVGCCDCGKRFCYCSVVTFCPICSKSFCADCECDCDT